MKTNISPKHELANRLAKYLVSFDGNKENNAREREELGNITLTIPLGSTLKDGKSSPYN